MLLVLLFILFASAQAQLDVLIYTSTEEYNGTERYIETDPLCLTDPFQFNGSSSLFDEDQAVWLRFGSLFHRAKDYDAYLVNPTTVPITQLLWWVFPCEEGDVLGFVSSYQYIPMNASYAITAPCHLRLPIVYACEGIVPATESPSSIPTSSPTNVPSLNPSSLSPSSLSPSSSDVDQQAASLVFLFSVAIVLIIILK